MEAIEFKTKVKDNVIHIPRKYTRKIGSSVKVIILSDPSENETDIVDELLLNPIRMK